MEIEETRADFLSTLMRRYVDTTSRILEVGSRSGANLHTLYDAGFTDVCGIELDAKRVHEAESLFPEVNRQVVMMQGEVIDRLEALDAGSFDLVFSVGYFEKGAPGTAILGGMARASSRLVITIEDERPEGPGIDFSNFFTGAGFRELESADLHEVPELESVFTLRAFEK